MARTKKATTTAEPTGGVVSFQEEGDEPEVASPGKQSEDDIEEMIDPTVEPSWAEGMLEKAGVTVPKGRDVWYMRFRAKTTHAPHKGDRVCILWTISDAEEDTAAVRSSGKPQHVFLKECAKIMIRAFDGEKAGWGGGNHAGNARVFWEEIGPKNRQQVVNLYLKTHQLTGAEGLDFLTRCIAGVPAMP